MPGIRGQIGRGRHCVQSHLRATPSTLYDSLPNLSGLPHGRIPGLPFALTPPVEALSSSASALGVAEFLRCRGSRFKGASLRLPVLGCPCLPAPKRLPWPDNTGPPPGVVWGLLTMNLVALLTMNLADLLTAFVCNLLRRLLAD